MNILDWLRHKKRVAPPIIQDPSPTNMLPSLDFAFDLVKEEMRAQLDRVDGLDTKANFIMGAATGLVGIALTIQATIFSAHMPSSCTSAIPAFLLHFPSPVKHALPLLPLLITSVVVMVYGYKAYKIGTYASIPAHPDALYLYLEKDVVITKIDIFERMRIRFKENERTMEYKVRWLQTALGWLMAESVCFIVFLLYQSLC
jgi:hypothetical protein